MKRYLIGRSADNDIIINDPDGKVSRQHAIIEVHDDGTMFLKDNSSNGTTVNGSKFIHKQTRINRGDSINFAGVSVLDWNKIKEVTIEGGGQTDGGGVKKPFNWMYAALPLLALGLCYLAYTFVINGDKTPDLIAKAHSNKVGLIVQGFYYKAKINDQALVFVGIDKEALNKRGEFKWLAVLANEYGEKLLPILTRGTGFFIEGENLDPGTIITNRHVAYPSTVLKDRAHDNQTDVSLQEIRDDITKAIDQMKLAAGVLSGNLTWEDHQEFIGILPNKNILNIQSDLSYNDLCNAYKEAMIPCKKISYSKDRNVDLALIQTINRELPKNTEALSLTKDFQNDRKLITPGSNISTIGFPATESNKYFVNLNQKDKVQVMVVNGTVLEDPDKHDVKLNMNSRPGASGSPIFDDKGKVIAVLYRSDGNFTQGILSGYIKSLIKDI